MHSVQPKLKTATGLAAAQSSDVGTTIQNQGMKTAKQTLVPLEVQVPLAQIAHSLNKFTSSSIKTVQKTTM